MTERVIAKTDNILRNVYHVRSEWHGTEGNLIVTSKNPEVYMIVDQPAYLGNNVLTVTAFGKGFGPNGEVIMDFGTTDDEIHRMAKRLRTLAGK